MSMTLPAPLAAPAASVDPSGVRAASTAATISATTSPVATLESVVKRYGKTEALRGLDLTLRRGEIIALLGPNGAGKTTAVRLLLGLISPDEGRVRVLREAAALAAVALAGSIPFAAMGFLISYLVPPNAGPAIINLIYLPLCFASGFWMPLSILPHWLRVVAPALPTYHLAQIALAVFGLAPATGMAPHWAVLGGFTLLMLAAAWITFARSEAKA
jgi:hypothetical protein